MATEQDHRPQRPSAVVLIAAAVLATTTVLGGCSGQTQSREGGAPRAEQATSAASAGSIAEGRRIFRFDTFGDEQFWTDVLRLHEVVQTSVDPTTALKVGLKVDADALPAGILEKVDLKSPATTVALLKMNAVGGGPGDGGCRQSHHAA